MINIALRSNEMTTDTASDDSFVDFHISSARKVMVNSALENPALNDQINTSEEETERKELNSMPSISNSVEIPATSSVNNDKSFTCNVIEDENEENKNDGSEDLQKRGPKLTKSRSQISVGAELREVRKEIAGQIGREMNIDLDHFNVEELLGEGQRRRDSLDDHLYHIACFPQLEEVKCAYSCRDEPYLKNLQTEYSQTEPVIDGTLQTAYEAHLLPRRLETESSFSEASPERYEVLLEFEQNRPVKGDVESEMIMREIARKDVTSYYDMREVSYLRSIENVFTHALCEYHPIPSEFRQNECAYEDNYVSTYVKNECTTHILPCQFSMNQCLLSKAKSSYTAYATFEGLQSDGRNRSAKAEINLPRFKGRPMSWTTEHNLPKLSAVESTLWKPNALMTAKRESQLVNNMGLIKLIDSQFLCTNEGRLDKVLEHKFDSNEVHFSARDHVHMKLHDNMIKMSEVELIFEEERPELNLVETVYEFNEPILIDNVEE